MSKTFKNLLDYGFFEDNASYTVVLDQYKVKFNNINLEKQEEEIKQFFKADKLLVE